MARLLIPVTKTQDGVDTTVYYLKDQAGPDCTLDLQDLLTMISNIVNNSTLTNSQKLTQLNGLFLTSKPANQPGLQWVDRDCNGIYLETTDADYIPADGGGDGGGGGSTDYGETQIAGGNLDVFAPAVQWSSGKARIVNTATPSVPGGDSPYYFVDGQPAASALPTTYDYNPGDEVFIYFAIATSSNIYASAFDIKGTARILIGNAPS